jgi:hypothetical protein
VAKETAVAEKGNRAELTIHPEHEKHDSCFFAADFGQWVVAFWGFDQVIISRYSRGHDDAGD